MCAGEGRRKQGGSSSAPVVPAVLSTDSFSVPLDVATRGDCSTSVDVLVEERGGLRVEAARGFRVTRRRRETASANIDGSARSLIAGAWGGEVLLESKSYGDVSIRNTVNCLRNNLNFFED